jgi:hypothetical protein
MKEIVAIVCMVACGGLALYVVGLFAVFCYGKRVMADLPFELELHTDATYIKTPSGKLRKIADHKYSPAEIKALAMHSRQVGKEYRKEVGAGIKDSMTAGKHDLA